MRSGIGSRVSRRIVGIGEVSLSIYGPFPKGQHYQSDRLSSHHDRRHHYTMPSHTDRRAIIPPGMRADMLELCTIPGDEVTLHPYTFVTVLLARRSGACLGDVYE